jgi:hypothetical protein
MRKQWDQELVRLLTNWAMWLAGGRMSSSSPYPAYNLAPPGPHYGNVMPVLNGEAHDVDTILVRDLPQRYQQAIRIYYCWPELADAVKARKCACSLNTYKDRVDEAHRLFSQAWYRRMPPASRAA